MTLLASDGTGPEPQGSAGDWLRQIFISGVAITIPLFVTVILLVFIVNFLLGLVSPLATILTDTLGIGRDLSPYMGEVLAIATLVVVIFIVGAFAETRSGSGLEQAFDTAMARIPGIGSIYTSFNEMSELLLTNETQSFREVKLVEFPTEGSYTLAFVTSDTPPNLAAVSDSEGMTTLFLPMAPNPVMGGFVIHVSDDRVYDVDLTVEEGIRSIVTSGVATGESGGLSHDAELVDLATVREQAREELEDLGSWSLRTADDIGDMSVITAEQLQSLTEQTRRELVSVHPNIDIEDFDSDDSVHYTLEDETEDEDSADAESETRPADDRSDDETGGEGS